MWIPRKGGFLEKVNSPKNEFFEKVDSPKKWIPRNSGFSEKVDSSKNEFAEIFFQTSILAMETIIKAIEIDRTSNTLLEFFQKLEHVQKLVQNVPEIPHKMSIKSGTELLKLATTRMALDIIQEESDINKVKETLINRYAYGV